DLDGSNVTEILTSGTGVVYGLSLGPDVPECSDTSLNGPWLTLVTGVEVYDYAVYLIFNGMGTVEEMGAFNVPDSAGEYSVEPDCDLSGYLWTDGYVPFTGHIYSDNLAEIDIGSGPMDLVRVTEPSMLEGCWNGYFKEDSTCEKIYVTIGLDSAGAIVESSGFGVPVKGRILTESDYLAGLIEEINPVAPPAQYMFLNAWAVGDSVMSGAYDKDCEGYCSGGEFYLYRCGSTGTGEDIPQKSSLGIINYPNPFNPSTTIEYTVDRPGPVRVSVYDTAGRLVRSLVDRHREAGRYRTSWSGRDSHGAAVSAGVFFLRFQSCGKLMARKIVLVK
ncbi:MAG: T9SS type A sorting domain-containing protein, partial [Candidatus Latescibacteria bacterium]|nr:T9SS type A sorting domain-containing protein [bacterium]MBD3424159.1 T9SS type A sorting domain-containing protein [Candidatus Latescibacterota bacterium]